MRKPPRWVLVQYPQTFEVRAWTRGEARAAFKRMPGVRTAWVHSARSRGRVVIRQIRTGGPDHDGWGCTRRRLPAGANIRRAGP